MSQNQSTPTPQTSVDRIAMATWRFSDCNGFVVKDWTGLKPGDEPAVMVLKSSDIFDFIGQAAADKRKIAVYAIGPCVIDWS
jgi:hypothetical protein